MTASSTWGVFLDNPTEERNLFSGVGLANPTMVG